jgi:large subunit ribosomal protein L29
VKAREAHQLNDEDLTQRLRDAYQEQFNLRIQKATRELTNTSRIGQVRKDIARIKTILRERELGQVASSGASAAKE